MKQLTRFLLVLVTLLSTTSCSITSYNNHDNISYHLLQWKQHQHKIYTLGQYKIYGTITCLSCAHKFCINFFWQQFSKNNYILLLINMLGNTELKLYFNHGLIQIIDKQGHHYTGTHAEIIMYEVTGILIPFDNLHQWIIGLPKHATNYKLNNQNYLKELYYTQNDIAWKIMYLSYNTNIEPSLPIKIKFIVGNLRFNIKIHDWII